MSPRAKIFGVLKPSRPREVGAYVYKVQFTIEKLELSLEFKKKQQRFINTKKLKSRVIFGINISKHLSRDNLRKNSE